MSWLRKSGIFLLVLLPLALGAVIPTGAQAFSFVQASQIAASAKEAGNRKQEIAAITTMSDFEPWNTDLWSRLGELYFATGEPQKSVDSFTTASLKGSLSPQAQYEAAKAWLELGNVDKARELFRSVSESGTDDSELLLNLALAQESINDSIGTLATLLRARDISPDDNAINYVLGIQFAATQPENAIPFLEAVLDQSNYQATANSLIQLIQSTSELGQSAERFIYIGQALSSLGEWQAAASAFDQAKTIDPVNGIAWALHGEAVQHVGESGYNDLTKALELNPHSDIVNGLMAIYYRRQQKLDLAIKYLYSASENNPNESTWQIEIGNTLAMQGQLSDALIHFQVATLMDKDNWIAWREQASFCVSYNYLVESVGLESARKALLLNPNSPALLDLMGTVYMILDDLDSAERFYLQAANAMPGRAEIMYHLGQLYLEKGNQELALSYLRQAAEVTSDARIRENANRLIQANGGG